MANPIDNFVPFPYLPEECIQVPTDLVIRVINKSRAALDEIAELQTLLVNAEEEKIVLQIELQTLLAHAEEEKTILRQE